jgi:hypothetical protein
MKPLPGNHPTVGFLPGWRYNDRVRARSLALAAISTIAAFGACGHAHPPLLDDHTPDGDAGTDFSFDSGEGVPKCEFVQPDGSVCGCTDVPLLTDAPTIYFVLDRSGSMNDQGKWQTVRTVVAQVVTSIGPRATFAAAIFPAPSSQLSCAPGVEVMTPRAGDRPAGTAGKTTTALLNATNVPAYGGTPTAATLAGLAGRLQNLAGPTRTFVILATDGGPNCDSRLACDISTCIANVESAAGCAPGVPPNCCDPSEYGPEECLDADATVAAVSTLHAAGVDTYVVGVPGSGPYADLLDKLATAGNTARAASPLYYRVDSADQAAFLSAISQIAAKIVASCTLPLSAAPPDPNEVNVFVDEQPVPKDPVNGWTLDGATITLQGATCTAVTSGSALDVRVIVGCPTVAPR